MASLPNNSGIFALPYYIDAILIDLNPKRVSTSEEIIPSYSFGINRTENERLQELREYYDRMKIDIMSSMTAIIKHLDKAKNLGYTVPDTTHFEILLNYLNNGKIISENVLQGIKTDDSYTWEIYQFIQKIDPESSNNQNDSTKTHLDFVVDGGYLSNKLIKLQYLYFLDVNNPNYLFYKEISALYPLINENGYVVDDQIMSLAMEILKNPTENPAKYNFDTDIDREGYSVKFYSQSLLNLYTHTVNLDT